jgi:Cytochrome P450
MLILTYISSRSWTEISLLSSTLLILYIAALSVYRLYFCPIARFPGPKLAALTLWYEFYFDVILSGRYQWKIREMHARYGPIVRISPFELHVDDPKFYDELYVGPKARITDKYERSIQGFGRDPAAFSSIPHAIHRMRRAALNPFFSKKSVNELTPTIQAKIHQLCARLKGFKGTGAPVNMVHAYSAFTVDVITEYMFARSLNHLKAPDFDPSWHETVMTSSRMYNVGNHFPQIITFSRLMPEWFIQAFNPSLSVLSRLVKVGYLILTCPLV